MTSVVSQELNPLLKQSLRRSKTATPAEMAANAARGKKSGHRTQKIGLLEAYIPVAVVDYLKAKSLNGICCENSIFGEGSQPVTQNEPETAVMFADVSSFTTITEKMTSFGSGGIEKLVEKLNDLFDVILKLIRRAGGDVMKFAGDAIEIYWPRAENQSLKEVVCSAVKVALKIQRKISKKFSFVDFTPSGRPEREKSSTVLTRATKGSQDPVELPQSLRVKLGIGLGELSVVHLGGCQDLLSRRRVEFIPVGKGIVDSHSCERAAVGGQVIISEKVFNVIENLGFKTEFVKTSTHENPFWSVLSSENIPKSTSLISIAKIDGRRDVSKSGVIAVEEENETSDEDSRPRVSHLSKSFSVYESSKTNSALNGLNVKRILKRYLPTTVLPYVNNANDFWLPEFRTVTTVFIKIHLELEVIEAITKGAQEETNLLQDCFRQIQETVFRYEGSINKMFFDKGSWNVLILFGLAPFAHDDDPLRGNLCALAVVGLLDQILGPISSLEGEQSRCSAGITTGLAFCGVLGIVQRFLGSKKKTFRRALSGNVSLTVRSKKSEGSVGAFMVQREQKEYSVIGDCVNLASRLMDLAFKTGHHLLCDESTKNVTPDIKFKAFRGGEQVKVKGKSNLVSAFQIADPRRKTFNKKRRGAMGEPLLQQNIPEKRLRRMSALRQPKKKSQKKSLWKKISTFGKEKLAENQFEVFDVSEKPTPLKRPSVYNTRRRRSTRKQSFAKSLFEGQPFLGLDVKDMKRAEGRIVTDLAKKKKPVRRSTLLVPTEVSQSQQSQVVRGPNEEDGLYKVIKKMQKVKEDFKKSCEHVRKKKSVPGVGTKANRRRSIRRNQPKKEKTFDRARLVCVEGSIGAGKSHAIAQVFYGEASKKASLVLVAKNSRFQKQTRNNGFSIWTSMFEDFKVEFFDVVTENLSDEDLILLALKRSEDVFEMSPVPLQYMKSVKKPHQANLKYLFLLNDIFGTKFEKSDEVVLEADLENTFFDISVCKRLLNTNKMMSRKSQKDGEYEDSVEWLTQSVNLVAAVFCGLAKFTYERLGSRDMLAIIDDAQLLTTASWLVCVKLTEWWSASNLLLVLGLRNTMFVDPNESRKGTVPRASRIAEFEAIELDRESFFTGRAKSAFFKDDFVGERQALIPIFRSHLQQLPAAEVISLKNHNYYIWPIIKHYFELDPTLSQPKALVDFFAAKTCGNPLYIVDAIKQYISEGLLEVDVRNKEDPTRKELKITPRFLKKLKADTLSMPVSVESVCGMLLDSLSTVQQVALKVAAMIGDKFNRKMVREAFPIEEFKDKVNAEWEGLVSADVIELADDVFVPAQRFTARKFASQGSIESDEFDDDTVFYHFQADWVKESLINRMLFKQRDFLREKVSGLLTTEHKS